ncbi:MAG: hypothetical protein ACRBCI_01415 [Cellvibrionaceae bacterium]
MKRLYYLVDNIDVAERISDRLHSDGITDWNFHVLGQDKAQIVRHHLHSTTPLQELDIIRSGERGILLGFTVGILVTCYIALFTSFGAQLNWMGQAAAVILFSLFGAWVGGLAGVSSENYKIRRFHHDIKNGSYLLLVDVKPSQRADVEQVVSEFSSVRKGGEDTTFINPFAKTVIR